MKINCLICINIILLFLMPSCKSSSLNDSQGISTNIPSTTTINTPIPTDVPTAIDTPTPTATLTAIPTITSTPGLGSKHVSTIDGMAMVYIPEGEFLMGSNRYGSREGELPHYVYLDAYWIDETEVTNTMFTNFLNAVNFKEKEGRWNKDHWINLEHIEIENIKGEWVPLEGYEDHPVNFVNWYAANSYCIWANRRMPTEAEWEKAARGLEGYSFPWGNEFDCSKGNFADFITYFGNVIYGGPDCDSYRYTGVFAHPLKKVQFSCSLGYFNMRPCCQTERYSAIFTPADWYYNPI